MPIRIFCGTCDKTYYGHGEYDLHRHKCRKELKPERTTDRTRAQIVADAERTWLAPYIVRKTSDSVTVRVTDEPKVLELNDFGFDIFVLGIVK